MDTNSLKRVISENMELHMQPEFTLRLQLCSYNIFVYVDLIWHNLDLDLRLVCHVGHVRTCHLRWSRVALQKKDLEFRGYLSPYNPYGYITYSLSVEKHSGKVSGFQLSNS